MISDTVTWLAGEVFKVITAEVFGLKVYALGCGCIYYRPVLEHGCLDRPLVISRNPG